MSRGFTITALEALRWYRCNRLAARINDLKRAGNTISKRMVDVGGKKIAEYRLGV